MNKETLQGLMDILSSSSEDDDDEVIKLVFNKYIPSAKPKINNYINDVEHMYSDKQVYFYFFDICTLFSTHLYFCFQFKSNFRVLRTTAYYLVNQFENSIFFPKTSPYTTTVCSSELHILSYLWYVLVYT